jgi:hypothetical protein
MKALTILAAALGLAAATPQQVMQHRNAMRVKNKARCDGVTPSIYDDKYPRGFPGAKLMRKAAKGQLTLRGRC